MCHPVLFRPQQNTTKYLKLVIGCCLPINHANILHIFPQYWDWEENSTSQWQHQSLSTTKFHQPGPTPSSANSKIAPASANTKSLNKKISPASTDIEIPPLWLFRIKKKCPTCDSMFSRNFTLKRHFETIHPELEADFNGNCT